MKLKNTYLEKRIYAAPKMEQVKLDNDISLTLDSTTPPEGPGEGITKAPEYFNNDPFKPNLV